MFDCIITSWFYMSIYFEKFYEQHGHIPNASSRIPTKHFFALLEHYGVIFRNVKSCSNRSSQSEQHLLY